MRPTGSGICESRLAHLDAKGSDAEDEMVEC